MHDRQTIRQDAVTRLVAGGLAAGNVKASRVLEWQAEELPGASVYTLDQRAERIADNPPAFRNETELTVDLAVLQDLEADPPWDDQLDGLCDTAERLLLTDPAWVKLFEKILGVETTLDYRGEGDRPLATARLTITLQYTTTFDPVVGDDLTTIKADWDMAAPRNDPQSPTGPDGQIDASDQIPNLDQ